MAETQKGAIAFGLVYIPIDMYIAVQDNELRFNQISKKSNGRVRYKKVDSVTGGEVAQKDVVKGYQYEKDKYVIVTDEDFEKIKTEKDRSIQILRFTDHCSISPAYHNRSYLVLPQKGGEKAFNLLRTVMAQKNKVAIGKMVLGQKETLIMLQPTDEAMLGVTLFFQDEIKGMPRSVAQPEANNEELAMADQLLDSLSGPFRPEQYHDEYQKRLRQLIESKIEGREVTIPAEAKGPGNVLSLMDALKKSLKAGGEQKVEVETPAKSGRARRIRKKKVA